MARGILTSLSRRRYVAEIAEPGRVTYHAVLPELQARRTRARPTGLPHWPDAVDPADEGLG